MEWCAKIALYCRDQTNGGKDHSLIVSLLSLHYTYRKISFNLDNAIGRLASQELKIYDALSNSRKEKEQFEELVYEQFYLKLNREFFYYIFLILLETIVKIENV